MDQKEIIFLKQKEYRFIRKIDRGGLGEAILLEDETINEQFVCKKYTPYYKEQQETYYKNFVQEIKILHLLNHRNIVRVFTYYLYPSQVTGYIFMEFVAGSDIKTYIKENPEQINSIFTQTLDGFCHLEEAGILHRDIRPENILVSLLGIVKIIDFGFGKRILFPTEQINNSISLNWRYTIPSEFEKKIYDQKTDVYFLGKLFEEIIAENKITSFQFQEVLNKMTKYSYNERYQSFATIQRDIIKNPEIAFKFNDIEKGMYLNFATALKKTFRYIYQDAVYVNDIVLIKENIEQTYLNSILENYLQNNASIAKCFISGGFQYNTNTVVFTSTIKDFLVFFKTISTERRKIVLNNIWQRLDSIPRIEDPSHAELPF